MQKSLSFYFSVLVLLGFTALNAQTYKLSGVVKDAQTGEKLFGASIVIPDLNTGSTSDAEGKYTVDNVREGVYEISVSYIGYTKLTKNVNVNKDLKLDFVLEPSSVLFEESVVKGTKAVLRETPVAFSEIKGADLELKLASRDVPMELAETPSVYASPGGGGAGDANLFVRGFGQRNIAVMVNGVPVNDMENKWVYWSNWQGIGDVIDNIQIQRGLGASPYSVSAVGGLVNMSTKGVGNEEHFIKFRSEYGSENLMKTSLAFHEKLSSNISATGFVSSRTWDGYAMGTYSKDWTYFFSVGGIFGNHSLELSGFGSPQEHGQRSTQLYFVSTNPRTQTWEKRGHLYNINVGMLNGNTFNTRVNEYYKPAFNLNWNWQIDKSTTLATIGYLSIGRGYGSTYSGTTPLGSTSITYRESDGLEDYDAIWSKNIAAPITAEQKYSMTLHRSKYILVNQVNNHNWYGLLSTLSKKLLDNLTLTIGIDGRLYTGIHYQEVRDLLGGDYWLDNKDINNTIRLTVVGDKVGYYNDTYVRQFGGFTQAEYKSGDITTFINVSLSTTANKRKDYFLYKPDDPINETEWQKFTGYTAKTGARYNLDQNHSLFTNIGYFSTAPLPNTIFTRNTNVVSKGAVNEKVTGLELGYEYASQMIAVNVNAFYTNWKDRAMVPFQVSAFVTDPETGIQTISTSYVNVVGANELHYGAELEMLVKPIRKLTLKANASIIDAKYTNDVNAIIWPEEDPSKTTSVKVYSENLYISEFPQQQLVLSANYSIYLGQGLNIYINPVYKFYGKHYSRFYVDDRTNPNDRTQPWRIPDYNITDFHFGFTWYISDFMVKRLNLNFHVFNFLNDQNYIVEATDGPTSSAYGQAHSYESAKGYYGRARWFNVGLAVNF